MAMYGPELMRRIASHALDITPSDSYYSYDGFRYRASDVEAGVPLALTDRNTGSSADSATTNIGTEYFYDTQTPFDPETEVDSPNPLDYKFERRDGRVLLRLCAWYTVSELDQFYTSGGNYLLSSYKTSGNLHYNLLALRVAIRREADADLPDNWVGPSDADIRIVYDHTKPGHFRVMSDLLVDVTELLCESSRYPELVTAWKQRFGRVDVYDYRLRDENLATLATLSSENADYSTAGGFERLVDGSAASWMAVPDADGVVTVTATFDAPLTLGRVAVRGFESRLTAESILHYAPYHWYIEGSNDGEAWSRVEIAHYRSLCTPGDGGIIVSEGDSRYNPVVVDLVPESARYQKFRIVFMDNYYEGPENLWIYMSLTEIELYEFR